MRVMIKFKIPTDKGNEMVREGKVGPLMQQIMTDLKPEAAYFMSDDGDRTGLWFVNMNDPSEIALAADKFYLALNAKVDFFPVMTAEDLGKAMAGMAENLRRYG